MHNNIDTIHDAVLVQDERRIEEYLEQKVDIESRDKDGYTALHIASMLGHKKITELLLKRGASIYNPSPMCNFNALHLMVAHNITRDNDSESNEDNIRVILRYRPNLEIKSSNGQTALQIAAERGSIKAVCILLAHGANKDYGEGLNYKNGKNYDEIKNLLNLDRADLIRFSFMTKREISEELYKIAEKNREEQSKPNSTTHHPTSYLAAASRMGFL